MHPYIHSSTIHICQDMKTTQMSLDRWMDKEDMVQYDTIKYYSAIINNKI